MIGDIANREPEPLSESPDVNAGLQAQIQNLAQKLEDRTIQGLQQQITTLTEKISEAQRPVPAGRTSEDIISEVVPIALEKVDGLRTGLQKEMKELREQVMPANNIVTPAQELPNMSPEEIIDLAGVENQILTVYDEQDNAVSYLEQVSTETDKVQPLEEITEEAPEETEMASDTETNPGEETLTVQVTSSTEETLDDTLSRPTTSS